MKMLTPEREKEIREWLENGPHDHFETWFEDYTLLLAEIDRLREWNTKLRKSSAHWYNQNGVSQLETANEHLKEVIKELGDSSCYVANQRDLAVKSIQDFLSTVSLDWYVDQYRKKDEISGCIAKIHNMELIERSKIAFYNLSQALKQIEGNEK